MKFSLGLFASFVGTAVAFAPAPRFGTSSALKMAEMVAAGSIDRKMDGVDTGAAHEVFDPTFGETPALDRNNKGEVWVPQVSIHTKCI